MPEYVDRIEEFPKGIWWIRWVDGYHVPHLSTGTASVSVLLSPVPPAVDFRRLKASDREKLVRKQDSFQKVTLMVGAIPRLTIGAVFKDGVQVGNLKADEREFVFKPEHLADGSYRASAEAPFPKPAWWNNPAAVYQVVGHYEYPLRNFSHSRCIVFRNAEVVLIIPCHEVFRVYYARQTRLARVLLEGPWGLTSRDLIDPNRTAVLPNGIWQIALRGAAISNVSIPALGNLLLNPFGFAEANRIHAHIASTRGSATIEARIPFEWHELSLKVSCVRLQQHPPKYLCFEILGGTFPSAKRIDVIETYLGETEEKPGEKYARHTLALPPDRDVLDVISEEDPLGNVPAATFNVAGPIWSDPPEIIRTREKSGARPRRPAPDGVAQGASPGSPRGSGTPLAPAEFIQEPGGPPVDRFEALAQMLDRMVERRHIASWKIIDPRDFVHHSAARFCVVRGNRSCWRLPDRVQTGAGKWRHSKWSRFDDGQSRSALVCKIVLGTQIVYWLEVETKGDEGFRYLLFKIEQSDLPGTIDFLLKGAVEHRASWDLIEEIHSICFKAAKHCFAPFTSGSARGSKLAFDDKSALKNLQGVAAL